MLLHFYELWVSLVIVVLVRKIVMSNHKFCILWNLIYLTMELVSFIQVVFVPSLYCFVQPIEQYLHSYKILYKTCAYIANAKWVSTNFLCTKMYNLCTKHLNHSISFRQRTFKLWHLVRVSRLHRKRVF